MAKKEKKKKKQAKTDSPKEESKGKCK